jgi:protein TonB
MTSASASHTLPSSVSLLDQRSPPNMKRPVLIVASVVTFHAIALWALQAGFVRRAVEQVEPVAVMVELIERPQPQTAPAPEPPKPAPEPVPQPKPRPKPTPKPVTRPAVEPVPMPTLSPPATESEAPSLAPPVSAPVDAKPLKPAAPSAPPAPPRIVLPSSNASFLNNAPPPYPPLSNRLREQGRVVIYALIAVDGTAGQASIKTSSGYHRLDQAALQATLRWRYVPGTRDGVPEAMWFTIPIDFGLD